MDIPGLGSVTADDVERYRSDEPVAVPALGGSFHVFLGNYDDDPDRAGTHAAIAAFLSLDRSVLRAASPAIYDYYRTTAAYLRADGVEPVEIAGPDDVWDHITPGEITVARGGPLGDGSGDPSAIPIRVQF